MSIANTVTTPQFLEEQPDWAQPVTLENAWATEIQEARDGSEQRSARREKPRYRIEYAIAALSVGAFSQRRAKSLLEQAAAVVVPIWTDPHTSAGTVTTAAGQTVTLGSGMDAKKFKVGGYCYFVQSGKTSIFRLITAVGTTTITVAAGGTVSFTSGAEVYPCLTGLPSQGSSFLLSKLDDNQEAVAIEEL